MGINAFREEMEKLKYLPKNMTVIPYDGFSYVILENPCIINIQYKDTPIEFHSEQIYSIYYYMDLTPGVNTYKISGKKINIVENSLQ